MEILLLLSVGLLAFIGYKLNRIEKLMVGDNAKTRSYLSTSLNPIFFEKEIEAQYNLYEQWQQKVEYFFDLLERTEREEIGRHEKSGKEHSEFSPSVYLKGVTQQLTIIVAPENETVV